MTNPRELLAKATEGPWQINPRAASNVEAGRRSIASCGGYSDGSENAHLENITNGELIVWLRNNAVAMLDLIEQADVHIRDHLAMLDSEKIDFPVTKIALKHWCAKRDDLLGVKDEKAD